MVCAMLLRDVLRARDEGAVLNLPERGGAPQPEMSVMRRVQYRKRTTSCGNMRDRKSVV